jgi:hypothetical protein
MFLLPLREKPVLSRVEGARMRGNTAFTLTLYAVASEAVS